MKLWFFILMNWSIATSLKIYIQNQLYRDLINPHFYFVNSGVAKSSEFVSPGSNGTFFFNSIDPTSNSRSLITLHTPMGSMPRYALGWIEAPDHTQNYVGLYYGDEPNQSTILANMFDAADPLYPWTMKGHLATTGWFDVLCPDGSLVSLYMSSHADESYIIVNFQEYRHHLDGIYLIQNVRTGLFLSSVPNSIWATYSSTDIHKSEIPSKFLWNFVSTYQGYRISPKDTPNSYLSWYAYSSITNTFGAWLAPLSQDNLWIVNAKEQAFTVQNYVNRMYLDSGYCWTSSTKISSNCLIGSDNVLSSTLNESGSYWRLIPKFTVDLLNT